MITTWVYSMDATMNMTDDLMNMYVDDANVQTTHKENAVSRINRAAFESGIDPMDPVTHATGCLMNISNGQTPQPKSMLTEHCRLDVDISSSLTARQLF